MPSKAIIGLIQAHHDVEGSAPVEEHRKKGIDKHLRLIREAKSKGAQIVCLQELFYGPYFCTEQNPKWYALAERIPEGSTTKLMQDLAKELGIVLIVPMYEEEFSGLYYNAAAVIDADGKYLGKYRKHHLPQVAAGPSGCGFWEKFYFRPGNLGYPVFETAFAKIGVYICYDRHFPEERARSAWAEPRSSSHPSARWLVFRNICGNSNNQHTPSPTATMWAPSTACGCEKPWNMGEFYGQAYLADPRGQIVAIGSRDKDEVVIGVMDRDLVKRFAEHVAVLSRPSARDV